MAQDGPDVRPHRHLPRGALASLNRRAAAERDHCGGKADICRIRDWHVRKMCANQASDSAICCTHSPTAAQFLACAVELSLSLFSPFRLLTFYAMCLKGTSARTSTFQRTEGSKLTLALP